MAFDHHAHDGLATAYISLLVRIDDLAEVRTVEAISWTFVASYILVSSGDITRRD